MNRFSKTLLTVATATALGLGATGTAQANALGTSILQLDPLTFNNHADGIGAGAILVNGVNITVIGFNQDARAIATLNGVTADSGPRTGVGIDILPQCVGGAACADPRLLNNVFGVFSTAFGDPNKNVSSADQNEAGSPVANVLGLGVPPTPAKAEVSSITSLLRTASGDSTTTNGLVAQFTFTVTTANKIDILFNAKAYLEAFVTPGGAGESSRSSFSTSFAIDSPTARVFTWTPDGTAGGIQGGVEILDPFSLNDAVGSIDPLGGTTFRGASLGVKNSGAFEAETPVLTPGVTYTLTANMTTRTVANSVPEPATLGLLGIALLGLGLTLRRRTTS